MMLGAAEVSGKAAAAGALPRAAALMLAFALSLLLAAGGMALAPSAAYGVCSCPQCGCGDGCVECAEPGELHCDCTCGGCGQGLSSGGGVVPGVASLSDILEHIIDAMGWLRDLLEIEPNRYGHILASDHNWNLLVPDLDWDDVCGIIEDVLLTGTDCVDGDTYYKVKEVNGYDAWVAYRYVPSTGFFKIADAGVDSTSA